MKKSWLTSSRFKSKRPFSVKLLGASLLIALFSAPLTWAEDPADLYLNLPEIEARTFDTQLLRKSRSGKAFLFESQRAPFLPVGRLLLFKRDSRPIFAVRILRVYSEKNSFTAKGIRFYGADHQINPSETFFTVEKIGDLNLSPPTPQDKVDINELEKAGGLTGLENQGLASPAPPSAEAPASPPPAPAPAPAPEDDSNSQKGPLSPEDAKSFQEAEQDDAFGLTMEDIMIEEIPTFDLNRQWLTVGFAYLQNAGYYFAAGGVRYGITLLQWPLFHRMRLQDSLVIEGGGYVYKALNFATLSDSYLVVTGLATVRYNLLFSPEFGMFFYGGALQHTAWATSAQSTASVAYDLSGRGIAIGIGFIFRVGPNWDARVDLGTDSAGLGLMLRF